MTVHVNRSLHLWWDHKKYLISNWNNSQTSIFNLFPPSILKCALGSSGNQESYSLTDAAPVQPARPASQEIPEPLHINVLRTEETMGIGIECTMNFDFVWDVEFFFSVHAVHRHCSYVHWQLPKGTLAK